MTWREAQLSLQIEAETRVGFVIRERQRMVIAQENAAWAAATNASKE